MLLFKFENEEIVYFVHFQICIDLCIHRPEFSNLSDDNFKSDEELIFYNKEKALLIYL